MYYEPITWITAFLQTSKGVQADTTRRQLERHKTIGFDEQNNALHVRYTFLYISSPSSAKKTTR